MAMLVLLSLGFWGTRAEGQPFADRPIAGLGKGMISQVAYSPDDELLAIAGRVGIWLYDANSLVEVGLLQGHTRGVSTVVFRPDGRMLGSGSGDGTVRLWDMGQRTEVAILAGHPGEISSVAFSADGAMLAVMGDWEDHSTLMGDLVC